MGTAVRSSGSPTAGATLIGRDGELAALREAYDAAAAGTATLVLVEGSAGAGKTALVDAFLDAHAGRVACAVGADEHDGDLALGVVDQLVRMLDPERRGLPQGADVIAAGAALVDRLGVLDPPEGAASIVAVDDVHWSDAASLDAIAFAWRRLVSDRLLLVVTTRPADDLHPPRSDAFARLVARRTTVRVTLGGFDAGDVARLAARLGKPVTPEIAHAVVDHTGGLPLHVRTVLDDLSAAQLASATTLSLPAPRSFTATIEERLRGASDGAVALVEAAAVWSAPAPLGLLAGLAEVDDAHRAVTDAAALGLLHGPVPGDKTVAFAHPLLRAAVYHAMTPARRHELHVRAAAAATDERTSLRHRLAASAGADDDLAAELASWAVAQAREGSLGFATSAFLAANRVATPGPAADDYLLRAAELMISTGNDVGAAAALDAVSASTPRRNYVAGTLAIFAGRRAEGERLLLDAWEACGPDDAEVASHTASSLGALYVNQGRANETVTWTARARELATPEDAAQALATTVHAISLAVLGRYDEAGALVAHLPADVARPARGDDDALLARGILALWRGDLEAARADLGAIVAATRQRGPAHAAVMGLYYVADAELRLGLWDDALRHGELAVSLADEAGLGWTAAIAHASAAAPLTMRGEFDAASVHVDAARAAAARLADPAATLWAAVAGARLRVARGDAGAAADLEPLWHLRRAPGLDQLGIQPWLSLFVDALLLGDRRDLLGEALAELERRVTDDPQPGPVAVAGRARAALLSAEGHHRRAVDVLSETAATIAASPLAPEPFEQALLELALGMALRRAGRRRAAVDHLRDADKALVALEARPWLERCERELAACGFARSDTGRPRRALLTPQELAVAHLVARGLTNREVAAELIVSVKTVEYHLGNVYPKLGVRSRGGLAAALDRLG